MTIDQIPEPLLLDLLRKADDLDGLDVAEDELLRHRRTKGYIVVIREAWAAGATAADGEAWSMLAEIGDTISPIGERPEEALGTLVRDVRVLADEADEANARTDATRRMANEANAALRSLLLGALGIEDDDKTSLTGYVNALIADRDAAHERGRTAAAADIRARAAMYEGEQFRHFEMCARVAEARPNPYPPTRQDIARAAKNEVGGTDQ